MASNSLPKDQTSDSNSVLDRAQIARAMDTVALEARDLGDGQSGAVSANVDQGLDFETVGVDPQVVGARGAHREIPVGVIAELRPEEDADEHADSPVAEATDARDVCLLYTSDAADE